MSVGLNKLIDEEKCWPIVKPDREKCPFGQLPVLTVNGENITESLAIAQYAAALANITPKCPLDQLRANEIVHVLDNFQAASPILWDDMENKKTLYQNVLQEKVIPILVGVERKIRGDYILGSTLSYADLYLYFFLGLGFIETIEGFCFGAFPKVKAIVDRIDQLPQIQAFKETRPKYPTPAEQQ